MEKTKADLKEDISEIKVDVRAMKERAEKFELFVTAALAEIKTLIAGKTVQL